MALHVSNRKDVELLSKIQAIAHINEEIFTRIKNKKKVVTGFRYEINQGSLSIEIKEIKEELEVQNLLKIWEPKIELKSVEDIFNDNIDYTCKKFEDIIRLNNQMNKVVQKFRRFGGSSEAIEDITSFMYNFELLQVSLGSLEEKMLDVNSQFEKLNKMAEEVNQKMKILKDIAEKSQVTSNKWPMEISNQKKENVLTSSARSKLRCYKCGKKLDIMNYYYNNEPTRSDEYGIDGFSALCVDCSEYSKLQQDWILFSKQ